MAQRPFGVTIIAAVGIFFTVLFGFALARVAAAGKIWVILGITTNHTVSIIISALLVLVYLVTFILLFKMHWLGYVFVTWILWRLSILLMLVLGLLVLVISFTLGKIFLLGLIPIMLICGALFYTHKYLRKNSHLFT